ETTNVRLYPNPTNGVFTLNTNTSSVSIYDLTGKLVKQFDGNFTSGYSFDISNLTKSIYLVTIKTDSGALKTTKLVKF
ncbi:MAG TPA: T9SS type A sorting domain-containing protein, partial [Mangrovimonas sp.]|nr:T9SS type A sorting domain-containing protein [Mangrovimonas sp.]